MIGATGNPRALRASRASQCVDASTCPGARSEERCQPALGGDGGVKLPEGPGRSVPRIRKHRLPGFGPRLVQPDEVLLRHVDLSPDVQLWRRALAKAQRYRPHGAEVGSDVLADCAVTPGGAHRKPPVNVCKADAQAVNFRLHHAPTTSAPVACALASRLQPSPLKALSSDSMGMAYHLAEAFSHGATTCCGRRIVVELRIGLSSCLSSHEPVVFGIGDCGSSERVLWSCLAISSRSPICVVRSQHLERSVSLQSLYRAMPGNCLSPLSGKATVITSSPALFPTETTTPAELAMLILSPPRTRGAQLLRPRFGPPSPIRPAPAEPPCA